VLRCCDVVRYQDQELSIQWLLDNVAAGNATLTALLQEASQLGHAQGLDWESWFASFSDQTNPMYYHGVNNAQVGHCVVVVVVVVLCCVVLCCVVLCCVALCCDVLCYGAIRCYVSWELKRTAALASA
jgi:hypothetical protein